MRPASKQTWGASEIMEGLPIEGKERRLGRGHRAGGDQQDEQRRPDHGLGILSQIGAVDAARVLFDFGRLVLRADLAYELLLAAGGDDYSSATGWGGGGGTQIP